MLAVLSWAWLLFSVADALVSVKNDLPGEKNSGDADARTQQLRQLAQSALADQDKAKAEAEHEAEQVAVADEKLKAAYQRSEAIMRNYTRALRIAAKAAMTEKENAESHAAVALARKNAFQRKLHMGYQLARVIKMAQESKERALEELRKTADEEKELKNKFMTLKTAATSAADDYDQQKKLLLKVDSIVDTLNRLKESQAHDELRRDLAQEEPTTNLADDDNEHEVDSIVDKLSRLKELQTAAQQARAPKTTHQNEFRHHLAQEEAPTNLADDDDDQDELLRKVVSIIKHVEDLPADDYQALDSSTMLQDRPFPNLRKNTDESLAGDISPTSRHDRSVPRQEFPNLDEDAGGDDVEEHTLTSRLQKLAS